MEIFDNANKSNDWKCQICNTNDDGKVILVPIDGTDFDGIVACEQIHLNCIDLRIARADSGTILYQSISTDFELKIKREEVSDERIKDNL